MIQVRGLQVTESRSAVSNPADDVEPAVGAEPTESDTPPTSTDGGDQDDAAPTTRTPSSRRVSLSVRTLLVSIVILVLVAGVAVMTWLYFGERGKVEAQLRQADNYHHAEQIAWTTQ
jgi:Mce-associated membrane protein